MSIVLKNYLQLNGITNILKIDDLPRFEYVSDIHYIRQMLFRLCNIKILLSSFV